MVVLVKEGAAVQQIWKWLAVLFASRVLKSVLFAHFFFQGQIILMKFTSAMKGFIYRKAFRLNAKSKAEKSTSDIVNMYTTDINNVISAASNVHFLFVLPLLIISALYMLHGVVGNSMYAGLAMIFVVLIINKFVAQFQSKQFDAIMEAKDARMKVVNEIFGAILIVKLNAWEQRFREKLGEARCVEVDAIWKFMRLAAVYIFILWGAPVFVTIITFTVYATWMNQPLTAEVVFTAMALFRLLQEPLRSIPNYVMGLVQARTSIIRLIEFCSLPERDPDAIMCAEHPKAIQKYLPANISIAMENATLSWENTDDTKNIFENVNLKVKQGDLVVIHGVVGSGKSSFCAALLGDMVKKSGTVFVGGSVAYCPQQAWIQHMTVRENILFGEAYDEAKYNKVIDACSLRTDIESFSAGDKTEIGEKGLNVSGGQKARISLARACYSNADIYILDSPLSAVDAIVQNEIFTQCLLGLLRHKTRVLVTHNPDIIESKHIDRTVELGKGQFSNIAKTSVPPVDIFKMSPLIGSRQKAQVVVETLVNQKEEQETSTIAPAMEATDEGLVPMNRRVSSFVKAQGGDSFHDGFGKLVDEEGREEGRVSAHVVKAYFKALGGFKVLVFVLIVQGLWQVLQIGSDLWLNYWTAESDEEQKANLKYNLTMYAVLALSGSFMVLARTLTISWNGRQAAVRMFNGMTDSLLKSPMSFFDANPLGRQLNRYGDDVSNIDFRLPFLLGSMSANLYSTGATLLTSAIVTKYLGLLMLPLLYVYVAMGNYYLATAREMQRLQKVTTSPVLSHISESVDGSSVVRAFGTSQVGRFMIINNVRIDHNNRNQFASFAVVEWFAMRMQLLGGVVLLVTTFSLSLMRNSLAPGLIGMAFNYALQVDQGLESMVQLWSLLETSMLSPERIAEYIDLPSEAPHIVAATEPTPSWPSKGAVEFRNVSFRYKVGGDLILKDLSFSLKPSEKCGIVGRSGAGKSSLTVALFRINEVCAGQIFIDGIDTSKLGLYTLRSRLSIITQAPVLFKGTLRKYLDPFNAYADDQLWHALRKVNLFDNISALDGKLDAPLEENGSNFSVGERQLLCMSRALLSNSRIVVMDEATAAIDQATDALLQKVIRTEFKNSTVITIAHRLDTVLDSDRIMVLDAGKIVQFDSPETLIAKGSGHFYDLANEGGYLDRMNMADK